MKAYFFFSILLTARVVVVTSKVRLRFSPFQPFGNTTGDWSETFVQNNNVTMYLTCIASYPTQWVFDADQKFQNDTRSEWTERRIRVPGQNPQYEYTAYLEITFPRLQLPMTLKCNAVQDEQDSMLTQLIPNQETVRVQILNESFTQPTPPPTNSACEFRVSITYFKGDGFYYVRCSNNHNPDEFMPFWNIPCRTSGYCSNSHRKLKTLRNTCTELIPEGTQRYEDKTWMKFAMNPLVQEPTSSYPGTVVCASGDGRRGTQEYFFTAPDSITQKREIHFSWNEIQPKEMIWLTLWNSTSSTFYTGQIISGGCNIPKYGFSDDLLFTIKLDNTVIREDIFFEWDAKQAAWTRKFVIKLERSGDYNISCVGRIWNTTELIIQNINVSVRDTDPPSFEKSTEEITLVEGEDMKEFRCIAYGHPTPKTEWDVGSGCHGIQVKGDTLIFTTVTKLVTTGKYTCTASNVLGQSANKTITVTVSTNASCGSFNEGMAVGVSVTVVTFLILDGFAYLYYKLRKNVATVFTMEEINEFRKGKENKVGDDQLTPADYVESLPYDTTYELTKDKFRVDTNDTLGEGEFGIVYKGIVRTNNAGTLDVAFKTVREGVDVSYIKALMLELKILVHLGDHEYIVKLIGAVTKNVQMGEIFMALELCHCSLLAFVRRNRDTFLNCVQNGMLITESTILRFDSGKAEGSKEFSTLNLIQWGAEIATALEFIASKLIIHGDIAARNILLTSQRTTKLSDFGLARQLVDYNYTKTNQCPLPWKWMAIESLRKNCFSVKSDVWAFGVTLWEAFSLGDIPYPDMSWSTDFVTELEGGLRPSQLLNSPKQIWDLMVQCWNPNPKERPNFTLIKNFFETIQKEFEHSTEHNA